MELFFLQFVEPMVEINLDGNCEFECSPRGGANSCHGYLFCVPDPYGCSCDVGAYGLACTTRKSSDSHLIVLKL